MIAKERTALFSKELGYFHNPMLVRFAEHCLSQIPDYFFHIPASSTGKYHPQYALGEGGLVRHTKAAMGIFHELCRADIDMYYYQEYYLLADDTLSGLDREGLQDEIYLALLLHDCMKQGFEEGHTLHEHPLIAAQFFTAEAKAWGLDVLLIQRVASMISSHMGKWNVSKFSPVMLPTPEMGAWGNKLVHLCDYLASRKCLEYNFSAMDE